MKYEDIKIISEKNKNPQSQTNKKPTQQDFDFPLLRTFSPIYKSYVFYNQDLQSFWNKIQKLQSSQKQVKPDLFSPICKLQLHIKKQHLK